MFANTCRHRGHELLPEDGDVDRARGQLCPYHAWTYDLSGPADGRARASATSRASTSSEHGLVELPVQVWHGWVFGHALHPLGQRRRCRRSSEHVGDWRGMLAPYDIGVAGASPTGTPTRWRRTGR